MAKPQVVVVDVPKAVTVTMKNEKGQPISGDMSFVEFLQGCMDSYNPAGKGLRQIRQSVKIAGVLEEAKDKPGIRFEPNDWDVMKAAVESMQWNPKAARELLPYLEAVEKAQTVDV